MPLMDNTRSNQFELRKPAGIKTWLDSQRAVTTVPGAWLQENQNAVIMHSRNHLLAELWVRCALRTREVKRCPRGNVRGATVDAWRIGWDSSLQVEWDLLCSLTWSLGLDPNVNTQKGILPAKKISWSMFPWPVPPELDLDKFNSRWKICEPLTCSFCCLLSIVVTIHKNQVKNEKHYFSKRSTNWM